MLLAGTCCGTIEAGAIVVPDQADQGGFRTAPALAYAGPAEESFDVRNSCFRIIILLGAVFLSLSGYSQVTNTVGSSGFTYTFSSTAGSDPTLILYRGVTYVFINTVVGVHPMYIKTNLTAGTTDQYTNGVSGNGTATVTFVVPTNAPGQLSYNCAVHSQTFSMHGFLNISNSPAPPDGRIVLITLSPTNVVMRSLGATNWTAIPEFSSNLVSGGWSSVASYTNFLTNGTNITTFDRLDAICGPNVFLRIRNQFP